MNLICVISPRKFNDGLCIHLFFRNFIDLLYLTIDVMYLILTVYIHGLYINTEQLCVCVNEYM